MSDLVAFLRARLDEDERAASGADGASWYFDHIDDSAGPFHERFTPARVLRDVEAKRRIMAECRPSGGGSWDIELLDALGAVVLVYLALPYADHEDYREEWRP